MTQTDSKTVLPSFSIVLETENLASANVGGLIESLAALAKQDIPPTKANEVLLIDTGDTPPELLKQLCQSYNWLKVHPAVSSTTYYQTKMLGAELVTGEIVVYYDSDCLYGTDWLQIILTSFTQGDDIQVVAGETTTGGMGAYGTAMALTYLFPQYSGQTKLIPTSEYFLNNVAFRRKFLLQHPIPTELPLYRGHCVIHADRLGQEGYTIWRQPKAKSIHAPPNGLSHFFWRFLLIGHDQYWLKQLLKQERENSPFPQTLSEDLAKSRWTTKMQIFRDRVQKMLKYNFKHVFYFPFALPIVIAAVTLIFVGNLITSRSSHWLLNAYNKSNSC